MPKKTAPRTRKTPAPRVRNPFRERFVTELIDEPATYRRMFSEEILVGETEHVFQPANVVLIGPLGAGKSMLLNLLRYEVVSEWLQLARRSSRRTKVTNLLPRNMRHIPPYLGVTVNLAKINFNAFGRNSVAQRRTGTPDEAVDSACAADFLNHFTFKEFLEAFQHLSSEKGGLLLEWLKLNPVRLASADFARQLAALPSWHGYYAGCETLADLHRRASARLLVWQNFLNANLDDIPEDIFRTKSTLGEPAHDVAKLLGSACQDGRPPPVFVVIDQYEYLRDVEPTHGTQLQRIVNSVIKRRDPLVFYKIGARTYDWGNELRVWGAESRVEVQRDYIQVDLAELLMRREHDSVPLFGRLAADVALKRLKTANLPVKDTSRVQDILGYWTAEDESRRYFGERSNDTRRDWQMLLLKEVPEEYEADLHKALGTSPSPLEVRLAVAWTLQRVRNSHPRTEILEGMLKREWITNRSWNKERVAVALQQLASKSNSRRVYAGWTTVKELAGFNIQAFLFLFGEIWDEATRRGMDPLGKQGKPLRELHHLQSDGIFTASGIWLNRNKNWKGGAQRYLVVTEFGKALSQGLLDDDALSNPGHNGFSLRETELLADTEEAREVRAFLGAGVSLGVLEERPHTSKQKGDATRTKWYFHPLLCPSLNLPHNRVKEPKYVRLSDVHQWIRRPESIRTSFANPDASQTRLLGGQWEGPQ